MAYMGPDAHELEEDLAGLDALEAAEAASGSAVRSAWSAVWPKLAAAALAIFAWQILVWIQWKPLLAGPAPVFKRLWSELSSGLLLRAIGTTMRRAALGYGIALGLGSATGILVSRVPALRAAIGSLITGVLTMPSIAWFPLAILLFGTSEVAIMFVVVLGAGPAIANGLLSGIDHVPPLLLRAGRVMGARGLRAYRHVIIPAALPSFIGGLKQGWAFAWRSLMAGELLVAIGRRISLGALLDQARKASPPDSTGLLAGMIAILAVGIVVDSALFGVLDRRVRRRWGLIDSAT